MPVRYSAKSGLWTDPSTWQGGVVPQAGDQVVIQSGHTVTYNVVEGSSYDVELGTAGNSLDIDIYGTLRFDTSATQNLRLRFKGYVYVRGGGRFECGTDANPMPPVKVTIQKTASGYHMFVVADNGAISLSGSPNLPPDGQGGYKIYTTLAAPASSGSNTIRVAEDLNWQVGDYIYMPRAVDMSLLTITLPFGATITAVTQNQDGTYTLTLNTTLPQNYVAGTHVAKANRLLVVSSLNSASGYYIFNRATNYVPVTSLRWVEFNHPNVDVSGLFAYAYFPNNYVAEYLGVTPATRRLGLFHVYSLGFPCVIRNSVGNLHFVSSGQYYYYDKCVIGGNLSCVGYASVYITNSLVFNPYIVGNASNRVIITNSVCYAPQVGSIHVDFVNCIFYGFGHYYSYSSTYAHIVVCKSCTFRNGCDGSTPSRFDWLYYNVSQRWLELIDCQFYDTWVEPSAFSNNAYFSEHRGSHPLPFVRFINKQTQSGTIAEQIFRAGGIITSDPTTVPNNSFSYSYRFEPKNTANFPLVLDIPLPRGREITLQVFVRRNSTATTGKFEILPKGVENLLPTLVTTNIYQQSFDNAPVGEWVSYTYTFDNTEGYTLRISAWGAASFLHVAWQILTTYELPAAETYKGRVLERGQAGVDPSTLPPASD